MLVFVVLPIAELYVMVQVSQAIGFASALLLLIGVSVLGGWLVRHQGLRIWNRFQQQIGRGVVPSKELVDGVLVLLAGVLLLTPGFITDALGIVLLLPPVRALVRTILVRRTQRRATIISATYEGPYAGPVAGPYEGPFGGDRIIDVGPGDDPDAKPDREARP